MKANWTEDPAVVFDAVRATAMDWRVVERADKRRGQARGNSAARGKSDSSWARQQQHPKQQGKITRCTCGEVGHRSPDFRGRVWFRWRLGLEFVDFTRHGRETLGTSYGFVSAFAERDPDRAWGFAVAALGADRACRRNGAGQTCRRAGGDDD